MTTISVCMSINKRQTNKFDYWVITMEIVINSFLRKLKLMMDASPIYNNFTQIWTVYLADRTKLCYEILTFFKNIVLRSIYSSWSFYSNIFRIDFISVILLLSFLIKRRTNSQFFYIRKVNELQRFERINIIWGYLL